MHTCADQKNCSADDEQVADEIVYDFLLNNLIVQFFAKIGNQIVWKKFLWQSKTMSCSAFPLTWLIALFFNCLFLQNTDESIYE